MPNSSLPATVATGFLGAGKTTLVNHILSSAPERRIGVLVNDFGEVNIDSALIVGSANGVISLQNGCICCSMKNDLMQSVLQVLEHSTPPEHLLVEASGVSNPGPLVDAFLTLQKLGPLRLDGVLCVVDALRFPFDTLKKEPVARAQLYASDLILLNKSDEVSEAVLAEQERVVRSRVENARVLRTVKCQAPVNLLLGLEAWKDGKQRVAQEDEGHDHRYLSFTVRSSTPFSFKKLVDTINSLPDAVHRIKGTIRLRERPGDHLALNVVGKRVHVETVAGNDNPPDAESVLVVIGLRRGLEQESIRKALFACAG